MTDSGTGGVDHVANYPVAILFLVPQKKQTNKETNRETKKQQHIWVLKWMIWGYHYFRKHPYTHVVLVLADVQ